jgi:hypothetical protein
MTPDLVLQHPSQDVDARFRSELSQAFCGVYFLRAHSIVLSEVERVPLDRYFEPALYEKADSLYFDPDSPYKDLKRCQQAISAKRNRNNLFGKSFFFIFYYDKSDCIQIVFSFKDPRVTDCMLIK